MDEVYSVIFVELKNEMLVKSATYFHNLTNAIASVDKLLKNFAIENEYTESDIESFVSVLDLQKNMFLNLCINTDKSKYQVFVIKLSKFES